MINKKILILGANGMLGHTVYNYLLKKFPDTVYGTTRVANNKFFKLEVDSFEKDIRNILSKINSVDYVINCIGILKNDSSAKFNNVNSKFPQNIDNLSHELNFKLIHVSTDAVFAENVKKVTENDTPKPNDEYGKSKLLGEPKSDNSISIRTSLIGIDQVKHKGFLEWIITAKEPVPGFINQFWSGCTTYQFAALCEDIIKNNNFSKLRALSPVFHFTPLGPITKYKLIELILSYYKINKKVIKRTSSPINRALSSKFDYYSKKKYTHNITCALDELISFEKYK